MNINRRDVGDAVILRLSGRLVSGEGANLKEYIEQLLPRSRSFLLDFGDVAYIDSDGIGQLIRIYHLVHSAEAEVKIFNLGKNQVTDSLQLSKLTHVFGAPDFKQPPEVKGFAWAYCKDHQRHYPIPGKCPLC